MAIHDVNVIDAIGINADKKTMTLLLTDHLKWISENNDTLSEYDHLMLLQEKLNAYISYLESGQYKEQYPDKEFNMAIIEIHFKYDITANGEKFLQMVQDQIGPLGIKIEAHVTC